MNANLVILNGSVLTMGRNSPRAEALAISGNLIAGVGKNADMRALAGPGARMIDAGGGTVIPGFIEGHMHLFAGAAELDHLQLFGVSGFDRLEKAIREYAVRFPGGDLIIGEQADYTILSETEPVTRQHLDSILPNRPFMMFAPDHHTAWANTMALERAGILKGRKLGAGNEIVMDADGLARGELRESEAFDPVRALLPSGNRDRLGLMTGGEPESYPSANEFEHDLNVLKRGLEHCARHGITSIHNMDGNLYTLELLEELERRGELTARVRVPFHFKNFMKLSELEKASAMSKRYRGEKLCSGFAKVFVDGVVESSTAVLVDDYADRPGWKGEPLFSAKQFASVARAADALGLQIAVHAIGDGAVRIVLDGYEAAQRSNGARDSRHRIEHIEVIQPDDILRFKALGVIASMQPPHPPGCHGLPLEPYLSRLGEKRWQYAFAQRAIRSTGAHVVFATDWPVSDIDPLWSIQSAMTRGTWKEGLPDNRVSLAEALFSYTREGAYAEFMEERKGALQAGMLADVAILSGNIEKTDPSALRSLRPTMTISDGKVVWQQ